MPFKLKLKKSRQYNVSSKNLFVISVELLDNTTVECTLSAQSLGQECLNNVCQRLGLHQPQYFGLCFLSKKGGYWWLDLQRPLKKQMDKYAQEGCSLYLGVMYFVSDVNMLHDEVARYHYFLQLKSDIIEGKLHCSEEQTILLAGYSLQAEFGDHDPERHTAEYLANFGLIPKHIARVKGNQEAIMEKVIHTHRTLQGLSQQLAEIYYIMECQHLEGYGQECFTGKDGSGSALFVCLSLKGIFIRYMSDQPAQCFMWDQIINLVHHKRCFGIECRDRPRVVQTYMEDSQTAKYVWKTCIQQHQFYTKNADAARNHRNPELVSNIASVNNIIAQNPIAMVPEKKLSLTDCKHEETKSKCIQMQESHESLDGLGVYHTEGGYSEVVSNPAMYGHILPTEEEPSPSAINQHNQLPNSPLTSSTPTLQASYSQPLPAATTLRVSSSDVQLHTAGTSKSPFYHTPSLNHLSQHQINQQRIEKCPIVPSYRPAPDYDTAVKIKYGIPSSAEIQSTNPLVQSLSAPVSQGQLDAYNVLAYQQAAPLQSYAQYKNYNDLSHLDVNEFQNEPNGKLIQRHYENVPLPCANPPLHTYSSPELASQNLASDISPEQLIAKAHVLYQFKPPPPYPYKQSSSTPDLTKNHQQLPLNSSQKCTSPKEFVVSPLATYSYHAETQQLQNMGNLEQLPVQFQYNSDVVPFSSSSDTNLAEMSGGPISNLNSGNHYVSHTQVQNSLPGHHTYQNMNPAITQVSVVEGTGCRVTEPVFSTVMTAQSTEVTYQMPQSATRVSKPVDSVGVKRTAGTRAHQLEKTKPMNLSLNDESHTMGPMLVAAMNGLTLSQPDILAVSDPDDKRFPVDSRIQALETKLLEGQVFLEFEHIIKKKSMADFSTALMNENVPRNRFKDVFPYEENRVKLTPTNENKTGYINASHLSVAVGGVQRFYIAAQGPLPNTLYSFWQMVWEHHVSVIVMLTEVQEEGQDKCFPYWPQEDNKTLQIGEFQIVRNFSMSSPTYITCSLTLCHIISHQQRSVWHIQYTDWPDHSCPEDVKGFIKFMGEVDAVRRLAVSQLPQESQSTSPVVVHCSAGVGRSGVVILCDIMLYALDHNQAIDIPKVLTQLRMQRMLTVQTLAQYKFVYVVLVMYLRNSRLI